VDQTDVINQLAGIEPGSAVDQVRRQRPETLQYAQGSYLALFEPDDPGGVSRLEREAIGLRVAVLESAPGLAAHHRGRLEALGVSSEDIADIDADPGAESLPPRLRAILKHVDLLTRSPRDGSPEALAELKRAGLAARDIVTISQIVAYLSYQVRMVALLQAMEPGQ
jgi:CMD domain protein